MTILIITEFFPSTTKIDIHGGVESRNYHIASYLAKKHNVTIIASYETGKPKLQVLNGITIRRVGVQRTYSQEGSIVARLLFWICAIYQGLKEDFSLVEGSGFFGYIPAYILGVLRSKKRIIFIPDTFSDISKHGNTIAYALIKLIERWIIRASWDAYITISDAVVRKLTHIGVQKDKITRIYCGIEYKTIQEIHVKKYNKPTISCVSRLVSYKQVHVLIDALKYISYEIPHISCHIIGVGDQMEKLKKKAKTNGIFNKIHFHGFVPAHKKVLTIVKQSHIFCLPSEVEGFGISVIEALAAGTPAVIRNLDVFHEVTKDQGVLFFDSNNSMQLAKYIQSLLISKKKYKQLQINGAAIAKQYDWEALADQTEELYASLCTY